MARKPFDFDRKRALGLNKRVQGKFEGSLQDKEEKFNNDALLFYLKNAIADYSGSEVTINSIDEKDHIAYNLSWPADEFVDNIVFVQVYDDGITGRVQFYKKNKKSMFYQLVKRKFTSDDRHLNLNSVTINGILDLVKKFSTQYVKESSLGLNKHVQKKFQEVDAVDNLDFEYVDLGFPSSLLWCKHNYGATSEEEVGEYYNFDDAQKLDIMLPTKEDITKLKDYCDHEWTEVNGVNGMMFTSKYNGKTLFFPAAGCIDNVGGVIYDKNFDGHYWTSSLKAWGWGYELHFTSSIVDDDYFDSKTLKFPVRPVLRLVEESDLGLNKHVQKKFKAHGTEDYAEDIVHPVKYDTMNDAHQAFKKLIEEHLGQEIYTDHVNLKYINRRYQGGPEFALFYANYYYREKNEKGRHEIFATIWIGSKAGIGIVYSVSVDNYIEDAKEYTFDPKEPIEATDLNLLKTVIKLKEYHEFMKGLPDES